MDTRKISYTKQLVDKEIADQRLRGFFQGGQDAITWLPRLANEHIARGTQDIEGAYGDQPVGSDLRETYPASAAGYLQRKAIEELAKQQAMQNPEYASGYQLGEGMGAVADPIGNLALAGAGGFAGGVTQNVRRMIVGAGGGQYLKPLSQVGSIGGGIPKISKMDALNAYAQVKDAMRTIDPASDRFLQLQIMADQYQQIMSGSATAEDFAAPLWK